MIFYEACEKCKREKEWELSSIGEKSDASLFFLMALVPCLMPLFYFNKNMILVIVTCVLLYVFGFLFLIAYMQAPIRKRFPPFVSDNSDFIFWTVSHTKEGLQEFYNPFKGHGKLSSAVLYVSSALSMVSGFSTIGVIVYFGLLSPYPDGELKVLGEDAFPFLMGHCALVWLAFRTIALRLKFFRLANELCSKAD